VLTAVDALGQNELSNFEPVISLFTFLHDHARAAAYEAMAFVGQLYRQAGGRRPGKQTGHNNRRNVWMETVEQAERQSRYVEKSRGELIPLSGVFFPKKNCIQLTVIMEAVTCFFVLVK
jgi:hypothetical protein